jgi:hypothetical protein
LGPTGRTSAPDAAAVSVVAHAPVGQPTGFPVPGLIDPVVLPTAPAGSSSHGAQGTPTTMSDAPTGPRAAILTSTILSTFGAEALPSAPAFDPGSTPD